MGFQRTTSHEPLTTAFRRLIAMTAIGMTTGASSQVRDFPSKPIRIIAPTSPGGLIDIATRILGQRMTEVTGQTIVIENRAGASTNIGTEFVARAPGDGYTLLSTTLTLVVNPSMFAKLPFNVEKDFVPISLVIAAPYVISVHPSVPAKNIKELVALAKAKPGALNYASGGNGTNFHIAAELLKNQTGITMVHVPYKGGGPALAALLGGEVDLTIPSLAAALPHANVGKLRALAITTTKRAPLVPNMPTVAESGYPGYSFSSWVGVLAPSSTPPAIVSTLHGTIVKAMRTPEIAQRFAQDGTEVIASSPEEFGALIRGELARWARVIKESGIRPE